MPPDPGRTVLPISEREHPGPTFDEKDPDTVGSGERTSVTTRPEKARLGRGLGRHRRLRSGIVQFFYVLSAVLVAFVVPRIPVGFTVSSSRTSELLVAIGAGTTTFIAVVYSLLFLVVQFGSTTFTPRLNLFRDAPIIRHSFGYFTALAIFSLTCLFSIGQDEETSGLVPIVGIVAVVAGLALFRALQGSAFASIQLATALEQVTARGRDTLDGLYLEELAARQPGNEVPGTHELRWPHRAAVLQVIDVPRVLAVAAQSEAVVEFQVGTGETISQNGVVALIRGPVEGALDDEILRALDVGRERTFEQDPALALRILADIALRALSPAINDPTSAVQALDGIDALLRPLATRKLDLGKIEDPDGNVRVLLVLPTWDDYLGIGLDEIIGAGRHSPNVRTRVSRLLRDLLPIVPEGRLPPVQARLALVTGTTPPAGTALDKPS
jgi:uncharacterized membrane protein